MYYSDTIIVVLLLVVLQVVQRVVVQVVRAWDGPLLTLMPYGTRYVFSLLYTEGVFTKLLI